MRIAAVLTLSLVFCFPLFAQVNYATQIDPLFNKYGCKGCHGGTQNLFLDTYQKLMTTGNSAPIVVASDTNSVLVKRLKGDGVARMPFGGSPVADADLRLVIQWILEGANEVPTSVHRAYEQVASYALQQNYPNPFNPSTKIIFSIGHPEAVSLKVYDVVGKEVAHLINETLPAGKYEVDFTAASLPSGLYFYALKAGKYVNVRRMTLVK